MSDRVSNADFVVPDMTRVGPGADSAVVPDAATRVTSIPASHSAPVVVIGDALIDELHGEDGSVEEHVGGAALNVAVGLTILGCPAMLVAMIGEDSAGEHIREHLARYGVGLLATPGPYGTSRGVSVRVDGEPHYIFNEAAQNRRIDFSPTVVAVIDAAPLVVTSCFPFDNTEQTASLKQAVRNPQTRLVVDANPRESMLHDRKAFCAALDSVAPDTLLLKLGDEDSRLLYGLPLEAATSRLLQLGTPHVLATAGAGGAALYEKPGRTSHGLAETDDHDRVIRVPITVMPGPVIDTMGAGDATLATIVADIMARGLPAGEQWRPILNHAMRVAAATCRHPGALLRLPS